MNEHFNLSNAEQADIVDDAVKGIVVGDDTWAPIPEDQRTGPYEDCIIVAEGKDWTQYSDGVTRIWFGLIDFEMDP